jgi:hypothetical protein
LARISGPLFLRLNTGRPRARQPRIRQVNLNACFTGFGVGLEALRAFIFTPGNRFVDLAIAVMQRLKAQQTAQSAEPGSALRLNAWFGLGVSLDKGVRAILPFQLRIWKPAT